ncbi:MAG: hypothetical protein SP1CHLAM54_14200 [Chlamydiia bacterium]|nr:hypothetical protein [Chlamydiia bacterium]MCH9616312.1 hypothetical protein [Chlamydiia bacterium]MCH9629702.1 hypothetical protein [Chlamydiia bacterium]
MKKSVFFQLPLVGGLLVQGLMFGSINQEFALANRNDMVTPKMSSDEEAFLIRRIAEFWKDGDYAIVKAQIRDFFERYPDSDLKDYFQGILGDLLLQENQIEGALTAYEQIDDPLVYEKVLINKLHCYYELNHFDKIAKEGLPYINSSSEEFLDRKHEFQFLIAESLFRQAIALDNLNDQEVLARDAKPFYEELVTTPYAEVSEFALAEIHRILGENEKAALLYNELAEKHLAQREDLLFQAGSLEATFDGEKAITTFTQIVDQKGKRANEAQFNRLILLFQAERYRQVIAEFEEVVDVVPESYLTTFHYIVGKSYFAIDNFLNAQVSLERYINEQTESSEQLKNALLITMTCANELSDEPLFLRTLDKFEALFTEDAELPKAIFMYAMLAKKEGNRELTEQKLDLINEKFPNFEDQESFLFEYGLLAHENEKWQKSYDSFSSYLNQFKEEERTEAAWKLFLSSSLHLFQSEDINYSKQTFFEDLNAVLANESIFNHEELREYRLLFAKTAYELERYSEALEYTHNFLLTHLNEELDQNALAEAHYLSALCHNKTQSDMFAFCNHLEHALRLNPDLYDTPSTHLHLFNGYITSEGTMEKAAEHLFVAISMDPQMVQTENKLWLANHYFNQSKDYLDQHWSRKTNDNSEVSGYVERANLLFASVLERDGQLTQINTENLELESEVLKYTQLLERMQEREHRLSLLTSLVEQQTFLTEVQWTYKKHALFELAKAYEEMGYDEKALETFQFIKNTPNALPTAMGNVANLETAKIEFKMLEPTSKNEANENVLVILNQLKELQIRKNIHSEPCHLESGLTYAQVRAEISSDDEKVNRHLFFLSRMKDDFTTQEDTLSIDYHHALEESSNVKKMHGQYMKFIDAEVLRLQAVQNYQGNNLSEMEELNEAALTLLSELKEDHSTPKELFVRVEGSIEAINALNRY